MYFGAGVVLVVQNAEFGVPPFAVQVEFAFFVFVEFNAPAYELLEL